MVQGKPVKVRRAFKKYLNKASGAGSDRVLSINWAEASLVMISTCSTGGVRRTFDGKERAPYDAARACHAVPLSAKDVGLRATTTYWDERHKENNSIRATVYPF